MSRRHRHTLFALVEDDFGFVTVERARDTGITSEQLAQLARRGTLERISHGVYRLAEFPVTEFDQYMAAALWPRDARGVLSHDTALDLYGVSYVNPAKVHITVPRNHRVRRSVPGQYILHNADLAADEVTAHQGIPVTTLARAIADCIATGLGTELIEQAINEGRKQGYFGHDVQNELRKLLVARGQGDPDHG